VSSTEREIAAEFPSP